MSTRKQVKLVHEGQYAAQVEVELIDSAEGWGPYLSLEDVRKLDQVRLALRDGDIAVPLVDSLDALAGATVALARPDRED